MAHEENNNIIGHRAAAAVACVGYEVSVTNDASDDGVKVGTGFPFVRYYYSPHTRVFIITCAPISCARASGNRKTAVARRRRCSFCVSFVHCTKPAARRTEGRARRQGTRVVPAVVVSVTPRALGYRRVWGGTVKKPRKPADGRNTKLFTRYCRTIRVCTGKFTLVNSSYARIDTKYIYSADFRIRAKKKKRGHREL